MCTVAVSTAVRVTYITCALLVTVLLLVALALLDRARNAESSRRMPWASYVSLFCFMGCSLATAATYWLLPPPDPSQAAIAAIGVLRLRDFFLGVAVITHGGGILWLAWPRRTKDSGDCDSDLGGGSRSPEEKTEPVPLSDLLRLPAGERPSNQQNNILNRRALRRAW